MTSSSALSTIEQGIFDGQPLTDLLHKVVVFSGQIQSRDLATWARNEISGYQSLDSIPSYRWVSAPLAYDLIDALGRGGASNITISPTQARSLISGYLGDSANEITEQRDAYTRLGLLQPLSELQRLADSSATVKLQWVPFTEALGAALSKELTDLYPPKVDAYYAISPAAIHGVVDRARMTLGTYISELRMNLPDEVDDPDVAQLRSAASPIVINAGDGAVINTGSGHVQIAQGDNNALRDSLVHQVGLPDDVASKLVEALAAGRQAEVKTIVERIRNGSVKLLGEVSSSTAVKVIGSLISAYTFGLPVIGQ